MASNPVIQRGAQGILAGDVGQLKAARDRQPAANEVIGEITTPPSFTQHLSPDATLMHIRDGRAVFSRAVKIMTASAEAALSRAGLAVDEIDELVSDWTRKYRKAALVEILLAHRVPHAPVRDLSEVINDPHMHARGSLQWVDHPQYGRIVVQNSPIRYEGVPPMPLEPSSSLGAENREVYCERLGLLEEELEELRREGVV